MARRAIIPGNALAWGQKLFRLSLPIADEFTQGPEGAFIAGNCRDVPQGIMKTDFGERPKICWTDLTAKNLRTGNLATLALVHCHIHTDLGEQPFDPFLVGARCNHQHLWYPSRDSLRPEELNEALFRCDLNRNGNVLRGLIRGIKDDDLRNFSYRSGALTRFP